MQKSGWGRGGCEQRFEVIVKMLRKVRAGGGGGGVRADVNDKMNLS